MSSLSKPISKPLPSRPVLSGLPLSEPPLSGLPLSQPPLGNDRVSLSALAFIESPQAMVVIDPFADRLVEANTAALHLFGGESASLAGVPFSHRLSASLPLWVNFTDEVLSRSPAWSDDLVILDMARMPRHVEVLGQRLGDGQTLLLTLTDRDEAEQRRVKADLRRQHRRGEVGWERVEQIFERIERHNQLILGAAGEGIYGLDAEGKTTFVNPAAERILGWSSDDMVGHGAHQMFHHTHADGWQFPVQQCPIHASFSDGQVHRVDNEVFWHKNGEAIPVEYTSTPIFEMGRLVGAVVLFRDIRERKSAERQLRDALAEVESLKQRLERENQYLQEEIKAELNDREMIGDSPAVGHLLRQIEMVAPTGANVLISGESGTGKELIARAIHAGSERSDRPLIRVNCAAIPRDLFESEFFGHVKGPSRGPSMIGPGVSSWPMAVPCFSMRSARFPWSYRASYCACSRSSSSSESVIITPARSMCGSSPPPTATCAR